MRCDRGRNRHSPDEHRVRNKTRAIRNTVLHEQQLEKILPGHGHEQALGKMQANLFLERVGLVLETVDLVTNRFGGFPVALEDSLEKSGKFTRTTMAQIDVFLEGLDRGRAKNIFQHGRHAILR